MLTTRNRVQREDQTNVNSLHIQHVLAERKIGRETINNLALPLLLLPLLLLPLLLRAVERRATSLPKARH